MSVGIESWTKDFYDSHSLTQAQKTGSLGEKALYEALESNNLTPGIGLINGDPKEWVRGIGISVDQIVNLTKKINGFRRPIKSILAFEVKNLLRSTLTKPYFKSGVLPRFKDIPDQVDGVPVVKVGLVSGPITAPARDLAEKQGIMVISYPPIPDPTDLAIFIKDLAIILRVHGIYNKVSTPIRMMKAIMDEMITVNAFDTFITTGFTVFFMFLMIVSTVFS